MLGLYQNHDLFGVDLMILRTSSSDMVRKETNLFFVGT